MDPFAILVLVAAPIVAIGFLIANSFNSAIAQDVWAQAAKDLGLQHLNGNRLEGQCEGFPITVSRVHERNGVRAEVRIDARERIPASLSLECERSTNFLRRFAEVEIKLGDPAFDALLFVNGDEPMVRAVLDEPCRGQVMAIFSERLEPKLSGGTLSYGVQTPEDTNHILSGVRYGVRLAQSLCIAESDVNARLARNIQSSDSPEVRLRGLEVLIRSCQDQGLIGRTLRALLSDPVPRVRVAALLKLGAPDLEPLLAQLSIEQDTGVRVAFLGHLSELAGARLWPAIKEALRSKDQTLQQAAAKAARTTSYLALAPRIARKLTRNIEKGEPETLISLAQTLGALCDPSTEPALVSLLRHGSRDVQSAAASALGELGSVAAVEPLLACSESMLLGGETKRTVLNAVGRIQSRLGDVGTGGLSLASTDTTAGALSIPEHAPPVGALSAPPEDSTKSGRSRS